MKCLLQEARGLEKSRAEVVLPYTGMSEMLRKVCRIREIGVCIPQDVIFVMEDPL